MHGLSLIHISPLFFYAAMPLPLGEKLLERIQKAALLLGTVARHLFCHGGNRLVLLGVELGRNFQVDLHIQVALPVAPHALDALALETEYCSRLS